MLRILLAMLPVFALLEWLINPVQIAALYVIKLVQLAVVVAAAAALRHTRSSSKIVTVALLFISAMIITMVASNILRHDVTLTPLLLIMLTMGSATLLPWGVRAQLISVVVAGLAFLVNVYAFGSLDASFGYVAIAASIAFGGSIYIAYEFEQYRLTIEQRTLELRVGEERYRNLFENATDVIYTNDLAGNFTSINRAAQAVLGYSSAEALRMNTLDVVAPEYHELLRWMRPRELAADAPVVYEVDFIAKNGRRIPLEVSTRLILQDGVPVGVQGIGRDISERRRAEAAWREAMRAAELANQAKSEFLANMSHEIRTPMNGIMGMADLALETSLTEEQREYVGLIRVSAGTLLGVINDVLDFSKIEAGKLDLRPENFHLRSSLGETMKTLALRARQQDLDLAFRVAPDVPDRLFGDVGRLRQVLVNLVGNAIKFTQRGGVVVAVTIADCKSEVADLQAEASIQKSAIPNLQSAITLHFSVCDTGPGIPADKQKVIFNAFEQADTSMARSHGGTGLGLAISARLAALMGGDIWVQSVLGGGSTFHFTVCIAVQREAVTAAGMPAAPAATMLPARPLRILLAEDNLVNQKLAVRVLRKRGHTVVVANNGRQAIACWERAPFDVVLMDVQMPEMDGLDASTEIRKREAEFVEREALTGRDPPSDSAREPSAVLHHVPIIAMTALAMKGDEERCLAAGMDAYLAKPISPATLLATIERLVPTQPPPSFTQVPADASAQTTP